MVPGTLQALQGHRDAGNYRRLCHLRSLRKLPAEVGRAVLYPPIMTSEETLDELEVWVSKEHRHHYGCDDPDISPRCSHADHPYVDSLNLVEKIRELKTGT